MNDRGIVLNWKFLLFISLASNKYICYMPSNIFRHLHISTNLFLMTYEYYYYYYYYTFINRLNQFTFDLCLFCFHIKIYSTFRLFNSILVLLIIINIQTLRFWNDINLFSLIFHRIKRRIICIQYECYFSRFKLQNYISLLLWTIVSILSKALTFKFTESFFGHYFQLFKGKP